MGTEDGNAGVWNTDYRISKERTLQERKKGDLMKIKLKLHLLFLAILSASFLARAQGTAFTYQGRLNDHGAPANGNYDLQFTIFDVDSGGIQVLDPLTNSAVGVSNGLFTVTLDFGAGVFGGTARWLEIGVRTDNTSNFTTLSPRQALTATPYAIFAGTSANVASGSVVTSLNGLKDDVTLKAGNNVTLTPNGNLLTIDAAGVGGSGIWSVLNNNAYYTAGNVAVGTNSPSPGVRLEVNGTTRVTPGGSGGIISIGTPNGETGIGIIGANRADLRFDGSTVKLVAGIGAGVPPSANGIAVATSGYVGIGSGSFGERLTVGGFSPADTKIEVNAGGSSYAALRLANNAGSWLWQVTPANDLPGGRMRLTDEIFGLELLSITHSGNVGIGALNPQEKLTIAGVTSFNNGLKVTGNTTSGTGIALENTSNGGHKYDLLSGGAGDGIGAGAFGLFDETTGNYRLSVSPSGNVAQPRNESGLVKAMAYIDPFLPASQYVVRCYNSQVAGSAASASPCGITATRLLAGSYIIDFGFKVDDRFISVTSQGGYPTLNGLISGTIVQVIGNQVTVDFGQTGDLQNLIDCRFHIIVF